ncbi:helix-turn-helix domain-containing protein, partial [Microvirga massiliensis]|uniref:helix-turn-helix domain-containing protein n=1 Tax=Microvirga massiliensis TaxID=1033741 RepID=UPI00065FC4D2
MAGAGGELLLQDRTGKRVEVPLTASLLAAIGDVLARIGESEDVLIVDKEAELSPEQAAKVLGISRPLVYHHMDTGRLPFRQVGTHRRVLVNDVLALKRFEEERRLFSRELAEDTDDQDLSFRAL